jgi:hypothetical protein
MNASPTDTTVPRPAEPLRWGTHLLVGIAIGFVAPFTVLAWPFAILVGIVIGRERADRLRAVTAGAAAGLVRILAVTGGVLAMLFAGAILGGIVAFLIVPLAAFSERAAAFASDTDRVAARLLLFVIPGGLWLVLLALGFSFSLRIGG